MKEFLDATFQDFGPIDRFDGNGCRLIHRSGRFLIGSKNDAYDDKFLPSGNRCFLFWRDESRIILFTPFQLNEALGSESWDGCQLAAVSMAFCLGGHFDSMYSMFRTLAIAVGSRHSVVRAHDVERIRKRYATNFDKNDRRTI